MTKGNSLLDFILLDSCRKIASKILTIRIEFIIDINAVTKDLIDLWLQYTVIRQAKVQFLVKIYAIKNNKLVQKTEKF